MNADGGNGPAPEQEEPIRLLARQEEQAAADFIPKLRRRIHRRAASSQFVAFCWELPQIVLLEMVHLAVEVAAAVGGKKEIKP
jgi:hypothetical protein